MPLTLLAAASGALKAIQQGCELYKEFKDVVAEAKETYDEVAGEVEEVISLWSFIKSKLFPTPAKVEASPPISLPKEDKPPKPISAAPPKSKTYTSLPSSELEVTKNLLDNLKVFFECQAQLQIKVHEAEEASLDVNRNVMDSALDIEYAMSEVEKMQKQIREIMVYQSPPELGDLYTRVVKRVGLIKEQQEIARLQELKKKRDIAWRQNLTRSRTHKRMAWAVAITLITLEIWGLALALHLAIQFT